MNRLNCSFIFYFVCSTSQALEMYNKRTELFGFGKDETFHDNVDKTLKAARVVILEYRLFEAIQVSKADVSAAKDAINTQINPRALEMCKIKPLEDINKTVWYACSEILRGKSLKF